MKHLLLLSLLLAACTARPPSAIKADRETLEFYKAALDDGIIDNNEKRISDTTLIDWDAALRIEEGTQNDLQHEALAIAEAVGDAVLRTDVTDWLKARYPEVFNVLDADENGVLSMTELRGLNPRDPKVWVALLFAIRQRR